MLCSAHYLVPGFQISARITNNAYISCMKTECVPLSAFQIKGIPAMSLVRNMWTKKPYEMRVLKRPPYGAVPVEENHSNRTPSSESQFQYYTTIEIPDVDEQKPQPQPQPLRLSRFDRVTRLLWDLVLAIIASLFTVFGIWVACIDGKAAGPESIGSKLFETSQYVSCPRSYTRPHSRQTNLAHTTFPHRRPLYSQSFSLPLPAAASKALHHGASRPLEERPLG